jgi:hypothetical protein
MAATKPWKRLRKLWLPALMVVIINLAVLSTYRFLLAGQAQLLAARVERLEGELGELQSRRSALEDGVAQAEVNRNRIGEFYRDWLATEPERLTRVIAEVKTLAGRAGVETSNFGYPEEVLADYGLARRSIVFSVSGTYQSLRQLINLLELSDQFVILDEIRLSDQGRGGSGVRVDLKLSTFFVAATGDAVPEESAGDRAET